MCKIKKIAYTFIANIKYSLKEKSKITNYYNLNCEKLLTHLKIKEGKYVNFHNKKKTKTLKI